MVLYGSSGGVLVSSTGGYRWPNPSIGFGLLVAALMVANFVGEMMYKMDAPEPRITFPLGDTEYVLELDWPESSVPCTSSSLSVDMFPEPSNVISPALKVAGKTP